MSTSQLEASTKTPIPEGQPVVAELSGGPCDGEAYTLWRARSTYLRHIHRTPVGRALHLPPRFASYELVDGWDEDGLWHARYEYAGIKRPR